MDDYLTLIEEWSKDHPAVAMVAGALIMILVKGLTTVARILIKPRQMSALAQNLLRLMSLETPAVSWSIDSSNRLEAKGPVTPNQPHIIIERGCLTPYIYVNSSPVRSLLSRKELRAINKRAKGLMKEVAARDYRNKVMCANRSLGDYSDGYNSTAPTFKDLPLYHTLPTYQNMLANAAVRGCAPECQAELKLDGEAT